MTIPIQDTGTDIVVRDNPAQRRYEAWVGDALAGFTDYHAQPRLVTVLHTEVDPAFEGRGVGSELVREMLEDIRRQEARVLAVCPFVSAFLKRHAEYSDLVWKP